MSRLAEAIALLQVKPGSLAIFWLGQAGYAFKTSSNQLVFIDAYLSNMCQTTLGGGIMSKRLIPTPLEPEEITRGLYVATHRHQDHMDDEAIGIMLDRAPDVHFAGPISCTRALVEELGAPLERVHLLTPGKVSRFDGFSLRAVYADHGEHEPDAIGIVLEADDIRVYHTGDTSYCPESMAEVIRLRPDVIIPCINGTYGNLDGIEAARLSNDVGAEVAIPSHYWFFIGQNLKAEGMPAVFLEACETYAPNTAPVILAIGESYLFRKG
jgi:L-ascorbate 6-phosphate lactonase